MGKTQGIYSLYRYYNKHGQLLYVGKTNSVIVRNSHHSRNKIWYGEITKATYEHYSSDVAVVAAETLAIKAEHPLYNVLHNGKRTDAGRDAYNPFQVGNDFYVKWNEVVKNENTPLWLEFELEGLSAAGDCEDWEMSGLWGGMIRKWADEVSIYWSIMPLQESAQPQFGTSFWAYNYGTKGRYWISSNASGAPLNDFRVLPVFPSGGSFRAFDLLDIQWRPGALQRTVEKSLLIEAFGSRGVEGNQ
jgi:hypothetical protein